MLKDVIILDVAFSEATPWNNDNGVVAFRNIFDLAHDIFNLFRQRYCRVYQNAVVCIGIRLQVHANGFPAFTAEGLDHGFTQVSSTSKYQRSFGHYLIKVFRKSVQLNTT